MTKNIFFRAVITTLSDSTKNPVEHYTS